MVPMGRRASRAVCVMLRRLFRRRAVSAVAGPQPVNPRNPSQASERDGVPPRPAPVDPAIAEARLQAALASLDEVMSS